jgi:hypothetical protein
LASGTVRLGDLLRHPEARDTELEALALFVVRGGQSSLTPRPDLVLAPGDELLLAGQPEARWALDTTRSWTPPRSTSFTAERRPVGWLWRRLSRAP